MNSNTDVRGLHPYNQTHEDAKYTDGQGRRVFFKEDGTPFVFDSLGRKITRFKGQEAFRNKAPASNVVKATSATIESIQSNSSVGAFGQTKADYKNSVSANTDAARNPLFSGNILEDNPISFVGNDKDPAWSARLKAEHQREKNEEEAAALFRRKKVTNEDGTRATGGQNQLNGIPIPSRESQIKRNAQLEQRAQTLEAAGQMNKAKDLRSSMTPEDEIGKLDEQYGARLPATRLEETDAYEKPPEMKFDDSKEKIKQIKYDSNMQAILDAQVRPEEGDSIDDANQRRLAVTRHIQNELGGIEAYQYAHEVIKENDIGGRDDIAYDESRGQFYKEVEGNRHYLTSTYDANGNRVIADVRDGIYEHVQENGKVEQRGFFTPSMIDGKDLSSNPLPFVDGIRDQLVLTDIGERELESKQRIQMEIAQNKVIVSEFLESMKEAKANNLQEQIKLTETVQRAFGLDTDTISSMHAFTAFKKYSQGLEGKGIYAVQMFGSDLTSARAFDATMSAAYKQNSVFYNNSNRKEIDRWYENRNSISAERIELLKDANEKADLKDWHQGTNREEEDRVRQERSLENEYKDRHYMVEATEENERQLRRIRDSLGNVDHTNEQAKKQIMNAVQQHMVEGTPISEADYDKRINLENERTLAASIRTLSDTRIEEIGGFLNRYQGSIGADPIDPFRDSVATVDVIKSFVANDPGAQALPNAAGYLFAEKTGVDGLKPGSLPDDLTDEERASFVDWSKKTTDTIAFNRDREAVISIAEQESIDMDGNIKRTSRFASNYSETLAAVNEARAKENLSPMASLVPQEMVQRKADERSVKSWQQYHESLERNDQLFRMQGDKTLYKLKEVHDNGTVIAERMVLPAKALNVKLNFEKDIDTIEVVNNANKRLMPVEADQRYQLPEEVQRRLDHNRTIRLDQAAKDAKKVINNQKKMGNANDMPINDWMFETLNEQNAIRLGKFDGSTRTSKVAIANKRLVDVMSARAGWMLRSGMTEEVASAMNMAMYDATMEMSDQGKTLSLASRDGKIESFGEEFEDSFTKHLHRRYFEWEGKETGMSASETLIRDVAQVASQSLQDDPEFTSKVQVGSPEFLQHVESETYRLLNESSAKTINEDFPYYKEALNANLIHDVVSKEQDTILSRDDNGRSVRSPYSTSAEDVAVDLQMEKIDAQEAGDAINNTEFTDLERDMAARGGAITAGRTEAEIHGFNQATAQLQEISQMSKEEMAGKKFQIARTYFGDEYIDKVMTQQVQGSFAMPNEFDMLTQYKRGRLDPMEVEKGKGYAYEMMQSMYRHDGISDNFFKEAMESTLNPTIGSVDRLRSYLELQKAMPEMEMSVGVDSSELRRLNPGMADMVPHNDSFDLEVGQSGDIVARSKTTNKTFGIVDTTSSLGKERAIPHEIAFNASSIPADKSTAVNRGWTKDGTNVQSNSIPLALNSDYNVARVTRSPMGGGYLSSSDVGTRAGVASIMQGGVAAGVDFETTGLMTNDYLKKRGLILPTEAYVQEGQMTPEGWQAGKGTHLMLNVGNVTDNKGISVNDIVHNEFANMTGDDLIRQSLGNEAKPWEQLSQQQKQQVMNSDIVSFTRNIGKYDTASDPKLKDYKYIPDSLDNTFSKWVDHAKIGLDELATGAGKQGVEVHNDLSSFMQAYGKATDGRTLVMQNGADADIPWANHFAFMSGTDINQKPEMVEMMHLSRLLNPDQRSHSLEAQVKRAGAEIQQEYMSGNHLADTDTKAMMRVFGENYLNNEKLTGENGLMNVQWMNEGDTIVKLGSRGAGKIPHDIYNVQGYGKRGNMHQLQLENQEGTVQTIEAPSLQELQRNISQNYKGFGNREDANRFLSDLTFDDAREDISSAMVTYDDMVRERNRAEGGGTDAALQRVRQRYEDLQQQAASGGDMRNLSPTDMKVLQNDHLFSDDYYEPRVAPNYSDRQKRAMSESKDFFESEDATRRQAFLGEVKDLEAAGVVNAGEGRELVNQFNNHIKQRAAEQGITTQRAVPGMVDLGTLSGEPFGALAGKRMTALANTYEQTEQELWKAVESFKPLTDPRTHGREAAWKSEALGKLTQHLKQEGIMTTGNRMEDAVEAVMVRHKDVGDMMVDDITKPLIQGANAPAMREAFEEAHSLAMSQVAERLEQNPALARSFERTREVRTAMEAEGLATDRMNFRMASDYEGRNLPVTGEFAFRDANDLKTELDVTNTEMDANRHNQLWKEIYGRATGDYDDARDAQKILGWDLTPDQYVHPLPVGDNLAGTRYADMDMRKGLADNKNDVNRIRLFSREGDNPSILAARASEYIEYAHEHGRPIDMGVTEGVEEADTTARDVIRNGTGGGLSEYVDEYGWERPEGMNRPESGLEQRMRSGSRAMMDHLQQFATSGGGRATGLIAAGLGAAFVARQWTRGDLAEERPEHDKSQDGVGSYKDSSPAYNGPEPSGQTYLTGDAGGGVAVQVHAKNRTGASQEQIGHALQNGVGGNANVNVHHRDDTTSISTDWLRDKFTQLLDTGYAG